MGHDLSSCRTMYVRKDNQETIFDYWVATPRFLDSICLLFLSSVFGCVCLEAFARSLLFYGHGAKGCSALFLEV